ncbi:MAG: DUF2142 domain-containing protein [Candidatus Velthaea sp.]
MTVTIRPERELGSFINLDLVERALSLIIIAAAVVVCCGWAARVPLFENPDEPAHFDYAYEIYNAGRLLTAREGLPQFSGGNATVDYLVRASDVSNIAFHWDTKVPVGYGTSGYYAALDRTAPRVPRDYYRTPRRAVPILVATYPFGYYAAVAAWIALWQHFEPGPVEAFFQARFASVAMFALTLLLMAALMRELYVDRPTRIVLLGATALFPTATFVASSVQPDVFVGLTITASALALLRFQRKPDWMRTCLAAAAVGAAVLGKFQYALPVLAAAAFAVILASQRIAGAKLAARMAVIGGAAVIAFAWSWSIEYRPAAALPGIAHPLFSEAAANGPRALAAFINMHLAAAIDSFYLSGDVATTWWGKFGWLDAPIRFPGPPLVGAVVMGGTQAWNVVLFVLFGLSLALVVERSLRLAGRRRVRSALAVALGNPAISILLGYDVMMAAIATYAPDFGYQARYWFPVIALSTICAATYAPRFVPGIPARLLLGRLIACWLLFFSLAAAVGGAYTIELRYYLPDF